MGDHPSRDATPRVLVALDFANPMHALALADRLDPRTCGLKVGKEMFVVAGPEPVRWMIERGFNVFLDLKFHDIPNTVAQACAAATRLGVWMIDVHAAGGREMLVAARQAVRETANAHGTPCPWLIGVTVLTSLDEENLREIGFADGAAQNGVRRGGGVARRRRLVTPRTTQAAVANGADYLVIGRPITQAPDPVAALAAVNAALLSQREALA
ncbi:MAG: orotidine 5'-phosphate decarboxylase / HUMPS family protein [Casimicrobiaceae bacterium]